jgi:hypothetical protein
MPAAFCVPLLFVSHRVLLLEPSVDSRNRSSIGGSEIVVVGNDLSDEGLSDRLSPPACWWVEPAPEI